MGHCQLHAVLLQESNCLEDARLIAFRECANPLIRRHTTARILVENHPTWAALSFFPLYPSCYILSTARSCCFLTAYGQSRVVSDTAPI